MIRILISTIGSIEQAESIARTLIEEKAAACVNLVPGLVSIYRWQGQLQRDQEILMIMKTSGDRSEALMARLKELHPYDVPEILSIPVESAAAGYLEWVIRESDGRLA